MNYTTEDHSNAIAIGETVWVQRNAHNHIYNFWNN